MARTSRLADVNVLAIYLAENHPGNEHVSPAVDGGLDGKYALHIPDHAPLRARWILTKAWDVPKEDADAALREFLEHPRIACVGARRETLLRAFDLARDLRHDPYDTYLLALALEHGIEGVLTTDTDFRTLAPKTGLVYDNPVPAAVLRKFSTGR